MGKHFTNKGLMDPNYRYNHFHDFIKWQESVEQHIMSACTKAKLPPFEEVAVHVFLIDLDPDIIQGTNQGADSSSKCMALLKK